MHRTRPPIDEETVPFLGWTAQLPVFDIGCLWTDRPNLFRRRNWKGLICRQPRLNKCRATANPAFGFHATLQEPPSLDTDYPTGNAEIKQHASDFVGHDLSPLVHSGPDRMYIITQQHFKLA